MISNKVFRFASILSLLGPLAIRTVQIGGIVSQFIQNVRFLSCFSMCIAPLFCTQFSTQVIQCTIWTCILTWLLSCTSPSIYSNVPIAAIMIIIVCSFSRKVVIRTPRLWDKQKRKTTDEESLKELIHSPIVQQAWEALCGNLIQEWIYDSWYSLISPDRQFPAEVRQLLNKAFQEITQRSLNINLKTLILHELSTLFTQQLELYRSTKSSLSNDSLQSTTSKERAFRQVLRSNGMLHVALCSRDGHYLTLRRISEGVISLIFTNVENLGLKVFTRELLSKCVLSEIIDLFTPFNVNKALLALLNPGKGQKSTNLDNIKGGSSNDQSLLEKRVQESIKQEQKVLKESSRSVRGLCLKTSKSQPNLRSKDLIQRHTGMPRVFSSGSESPSLDSTSTKSSDLNNTMDILSSPSSLPDLNESTRTSGMDKQDSLASSKASKVSQGELPIGFIGHPRACVVAPEISCNGRREYVVFKIRVADERGEWTVTRRYRNFEALHKVLRELPTYRQMRLRLPPKRFIPRSQKTEFVEQRRVALDRYLQGILSNEVLTKHVEVWLFLSVQNHPPFKPDLSIGMWKSFSENVENARYQIRRKLVHSFGWESRVIFPEQQEAFHGLERSGSGIDSIKRKVGSSNKEEDFKTSLQYRSSYSSFSSIETPNETSLSKVSNCFLHKHSSFDDKEEMFLFRNYGKTKTRWSRTPLIKSFSSGILMNESEPLSRVLSANELTHLDHGHWNPIRTQSKIPKSVMSRSGGDHEATNNGMRKAKSCVNISCALQMGLEQGTEDEVIASPIRSSSEDHPEMNASLFNFINAVLDIPSQSVFTRQIVQVSHHIFSLLAGDVIDVYLSRKLELLSSERSIAWMITSLKDCLWPNGKWFAKCKQEDNTSDDEKSESLKRVTNSDTVEEESDARVISEELRVQLFENLPVAFACLLGQKDLVCAIKDVYDMLQMKTFVRQIGYGVLEIGILALFPELENLFLKIHNEAKKDQERSE